VAKVPGIRNPRSDNTPPTIPQDLFAVVLSATSIALSWTASTDTGVGVAGYQVWKNGSPHQTTTSLSYTVIGLTAGTEYTFNVSAYDSQGNMSPLSETVTETTDGASNAAPVWGAIAQQELTTGTGYSLPLGSYASDPDSDPLTVTHVSGTLPTGVTYNSTTKIVSGTPTAISTTTVVFRASDGTDSTDVDVVFNCLAADTTAPSVPTSLAGSSDGGESVTLTWAASSDTEVAGARTSGLAGYKVYRDSALRATLGNVLTYTDSSVAANVSYSYAVTAYDVAGNASGQATVVVVTSPQFGWTIPDTTLALPASGWSTGNSPVAGTGATFALSQYANYAGQAPRYTITSGGGTGISVDEDTGLLTVDSTAVQTTLVTVTVDLVEDVTVEQDWIDRSTYDGVVWAHPFQAQAEVDNFLKEDPDAATTTTYWDPTAGPNGVGACVHDIPGNDYARVTAMTETTSTTAMTALVTLDSDIELTTTDELRFSGLTEAWAAFNTVSQQGIIKSYPITQVVSPTQVRISTLAEDPGAPASWDVNPAGFAPYSGSSSTITAQRCRVSEGSWSRPFSALSSGNGLNGGVGAEIPDRGIAALSMPGRAWSTTWSSSRTTRWRKDWYGHANYGSLLATWKDHNSLFQDDQYRGSDFWMQWRIKIEGTRFQSSGVVPRNDHALKYLAASVMAPTTSPTHEVTFHDTNVWWREGGSGNENFLASSGGRISGYTGQNLSEGEFWGTTGVNSLSGSDIYQPNGDFDSTCRVISNQAPSAESACFRIKPDEWYVFLMHVVPGLHHNNFRNASDVFIWPTADTPLRGTGIQLWGQSQTNIDLARAAGTIPTYQTIINKIGAFAFPFHFDNGYIDDPLVAANYGAVPPAWNNFYFWSYQNNLPQYAGFRRWFAQPIFKKGSGVQNQNYTTVDPNVDGIPCPRI
jgi:hypothetical protein